MSMSRHCSVSTWRSERRPRAPALRVLVPLLLGSMVAPGCGLTPAEWFEQDVYYVEAVPDTKRTRIGGAAVSGSGEDPAITVAVMAPLVDELNRITLSTLRVAEFVTAAQPDERGETHRLWGPDHSPLYDMSYELWVEESAPARFDYELAAAPGVTSDLDTVVLRGEYQGADLGRGVGRFELDLDVASALVPGVFASPEAGGLATVIHEIGPETMAVGMDLGQTVVDAATGVLIESGGQYAFRADEDGGQLCYAATDDVLGGSGREDLFVVARWLPGGRGRADGHISGGEVGPRVEFVECWDDGGARIYWYDSGGNVVGSPSDCPIDDDGTPDPDLPTGCEELFPVWP